MKRIIIGAILVLLIVGIAFAAESPTNFGIMQAKIVEIIPENPTEEVIPPAVEIIPDTPIVTQMKERIRMLEYETPLGLGFVVMNVGICFE